MILFSPFIIPSIPFNAPHLPFLHKHIFLLLLIYVQIFILLLVYAFNLDKFSIQQAPHQAAFEIAFFTVLFMLSYLFFFSPLLLYVVFSVSFLILLLSSTTMYLLYFHPSFSHTPYLMPLKPHPINLSTNLEHHRKPIQLFFICFLISPFSRYIISQYTSFLLFPLLSCYLYLLPIVNV